MNISILDHVGKKAGMDYYSGSLAKGFLSQACKVTVYSNFIGIEPDKINYTTLYEGHSNSSSFMKLNRYLLATVKASFSAKKQKTDLVIVHLFSATPIMIPLILIPKLFGLKIAVISHDVSSFTDNDSSLVQNFIYNTLADFIIVHNKFSYKSILENIKVKNPKKIVVIKHGGYLDHIGRKPQKEDLRKELGLEVNGKYILFFGQIKEVKGLDILLEAMSLVPTDIKLIIAGKPWKTDFSKYEEIIKKYNLESRIVKMIRFIKDDEREKLFFAADVNVLPYRIIYQSGVLLMAMSHGLAVIASDLPANKEIINNRKNGLLFESENSQSLSEIIQTYFNKNQNQNTLSLNAYKTIENAYSWNEISKQYLNLLEKTL